MQLVTMINNMEHFEEFIRQHDQYQFEVKLGYNLNRDAKQDRYKVETFFYVPDNLDINSATYSKNEFYKDLLLYIRFKTPDFTLNELTDEANQRSPLQNISRKFDLYKKDPTPYHQEILDHEIRLLGCVLKSTMRDHIRCLDQFLRRVGGKKKDDQYKAEITPLINDFVNGVSKITHTYRSLQENFKDASIAKALTLTYFFTDEFISLLIESRSHQITRLLDKTSSSKLLSDLKNTVTRLIKNEINYRRSMGYPSLIEENKDNEVLVFRLGVLKKFISSTLHLSLRTVEEGKGLQQVALAAAAGIAMLFATSVAFFYQRIYGTLSLSFFIALVVSYMFKDRIKALIQSYFQRVLSKNLYDQSSNIRNPFTNKVIGICREMMHFMPESSLDPMVNRLRNRDHITEIENNWRSERIIHYVKEIILKPHAHGSDTSRKTAVTDIVRFNVHNFLRKMDEPSIPLYFLKDDRSHTVKGTRVYHINLIVKSTSQSHIFYERIRLVLTRQGIKRIEPVSGKTVTL